jgi:choline dehydrogenase-like flavoprotein
MLPSDARLSVLCGATVAKILLEKEEDRCIARGVRFQVGGKEYEVLARKEVVLSGGSVASPKILELSGVGNPKVLREAGIDAVVDSPMVGERLQDHISAYITRYFHTGDDAVCLRYLSD